MNEYPGVIGRKLGMTQVIAEDGTVTPCTVIQAESVVVGKRTAAKDGYDALILGNTEKKEKHTRKPALGLFKKAGVTPKVRLGEFRCTAEYAAKYEVGQAMKIADVFADGQLVDIRGVSKGKGFAGVMKRHHFSGAKASHGAHEYKRHGGSIGTNMTPGRVLPGRRMPGQLGNKTSSVLSQKIVRVIADKSLILVRGGVPGGTNGFIEVRGAVKKNGGMPKTDGN
jgi:large subunit ribosomal protein L3